MTDSSSPSTDSSRIFGALPLHLPPETLKSRLAAMIRLACTQGSAPVAETVSRYFQALSLHPSLSSDPNERAAYCRGAQHWKGLALATACAAD
jgi:hypothetical protein